MHKGLKHNLYRKQINTITTRMLTHKDWKQDAHQDAEFHPVQCGVGVGVGVGGGGGPNHPTSHTLTHPEVYYST